MYKRILPLMTTALLMLFGLQAKAQVTSFPNETLNYMISYKWGFIEKDAANATLRLINNPTNCEIELTASTLPWADKIFCVRDTLQSWINPTTLKPIKYIKTTHENGKYGKDVLTYKYNGNEVTGVCNRTKIVDGVKNTSVYKSTVTGNTYDMLSIFYYIRTIDFNKLSPGQTITCNILSGSSPEKITISNLGTENTTMPDGSTYNCYHIQFTFTSNNGTSVSAPMDTWITTDNLRLPVKLIGTLPIGKVRAFLTSSM